MADQPDPIDAELVEDTTGTTVPPATDYSDAGVPSFDYVRDRIEHRSATAVGARELADATPEGQDVEDQFAARERAGLDKLEEIRRQMRGE